MLAIIYLRYKFPPDEGGLVALTFVTLAVGAIAGSLVSLWVLFRRWDALSVWERLRLGFYALFL